MSRVSARLLRALTARDGRVCAWTGETSARLVPHHRANRGAGGRPSLEVVSNLVWLDSGINGLIESDAAWAREARARGIKISSHSVPRDEQITHALHGLVLLGDGGEVTNWEVVL
jgi:hypothetical protein